MRLGQLIAILEMTPPEWHVEFSDGTPPGEFASWRGVYAQLTLCPGKEPVTVGELLAAAVAADGGEFYGYKGGYFTMDRNTPVWSDRWGSAAGRGITGSHTGDHLLVLHAEQIPDEYREMW